MTAQPGRFPCVSSLARRCSAIGFTRIADDRALTSETAFPRGRRCTESITARTGASARRPSTVTHSDGASSRVVWRRAPVPATAGNDHTWLPWRVGEAVQSRCADPTGNSTRREQLDREPVSPGRCRGDREAIDALRLTNDGAPLRQSPQLLRESPPACAWADVKHPRCPARRAIRRSREYESSFDGATLTPIDESKIRGRRAKHATVTRAGTTVQGLRDPWYCACSYRRRAQYQAGPAAGEMLSSYEHQFGGARVTPAVTGQTEPARSDSRNRITDSGVRCPRNEEVAAHEQNRLAGPSPQSEVGLRSLRPSVIA